MPAFDTWPFSPIPPATPSCSTTATRHAKRRRSALRAHVGSVQRTQIRIGRPLKDQARSRSSSCSAVKIFDRRLASNSQQCGLRRRACRRPPRALWRRRLKLGRRRVEMRSAIRAQRGRGRGRRHGCHPRHDPRPPPELSARDAASQLCWQGGSVPPRGWRGQALRAGRDVCSIGEQTELRTHRSGVVWASARARRSTRLFAYHPRLSWSTLSCRLVGRMPEQHAARVRGACRTEVPTVVRPSPRERPAEPRVTAVTALRCLPLDQFAGDREGASECCDVLADALDRLVVGVVGGVDRGVDPVRDRDHLALAHPARGDRGRADPQP